MPLYTFFSEEGQTVDKFYPMAEAPKFGTAITEDGTEYVRKPVAPRVAVQNTCVVAASLPRWDKRAPNHTADGKPAFETKAQIKEYEARNEKEWTWD
jgi:hypothetical protein